MESAERFANKIPLAQNTSGAIPFRIILSYVFDYAIIIILAIIYGVLDKIVTPFSQRFSLNDISIQYPYAYHERIPIYLAMVISLLFPIIVIAIYTLIIDGIFSHSSVGRPRTKYTFRARLWELNCGVLGLLLAQGAAFVITGTLKNLIGRPRPDLISRCQPQAGAADLRPFGLSSKGICQQTDAAIMQDGFRSFPSGHSSSSFAGLFYLSLYLTGKLHVLDQRGEVWRTVIVLIPVLAASCIAASRIMDARHHPFDVLFGSALGVLVAWASYRQYFPALSHTWEKGRAYPIRTWGVRMKRPAAVVDDKTDDEDAGYDEAVRLEPMGSPVTDTEYHGAVRRDMDLDNDDNHVVGNSQHRSSGNAFRDQMHRNQGMRAGMHSPGHGDGD